MREPGRAAIGTWSGGRFLHFGEAIDEGRLQALLCPGEGIDTVLTADAYGQGEADELLGRAVQGVARDDYSLVGAVGHDLVLVADGGSPGHADGVIRRSGGLGSNKTREQERGEEGKG